MCPERSAEASSIVEGYRIKQTAAAERSV